MRLILIALLLAMPGFGADLWPFGGGGGNATKIRGVTVKASLGCTDGQVLTYVSANTQFECTDVSVAGGGGGSTATTSFTSQTSVTLTHNFGLSSPYTIPYSCVSSTAPLIPATITYATNSITFTFSPAATGSCAAGVAAGGSMTYPGAGFAISDGAAWGTSRTIAAGTGVAVANGDGVSGNPTISADTAVMLSRKTDQIGTGKYCASTTGNDTYTCSVTPALTSSEQVAGSCIVLLPDAANTGAATVAVNGLTARSILTRAGASLSDGDITADQPISLCLNASNQYIIQGDGGGSGTLQLAQTPLTTRGDLLTVNSTPGLARLAKGTQYQVLLGGATDPTWGAVDLSQATAVTGVLPAANIDTAIARLASPTFTGTVSGANGSFSGSMTITSHMLGSADVRAGATNRFYWSGRSLVSSPSDGVVLMTNQGATDFGRLQLGGTTSASAALKRFGNAVAHRAADDTVPTFSALTACASGGEGALMPVSDSTTATWGDTITGGGSNRVLAYCNGTNWTVAAK